MGLLVIFLLVILMVTCNSRYKTNNQEANDQYDENRNQLRFSGLLLLLYSHNIIERNHDAIAQLQNAKKFVNSLCGSGYCLI